MTVMTTGQAVVNVINLNSQGVSIASIMTSIRKEDGLQAAAGLLNSGASLASIMAFTPVIAGVAVGKKGAGGIKK